MTARAWPRWCGCAGEATSCRASSILGTVEKLRHLQRLGAADIDIALLNPNLRKSLARLGRTSTPRTLTQMNPERRYPILLAFLEHARQAVVDELVEQVDRCRGDTHARARRQLEELKLANTRQTSPLMRLLRDLCRLTNDMAIPDAELRRAIYERCARPSTS